MVGVSEDNVTSALFELDEICSKQLVIGWPSACILDTTPAVADTIDVWQLNGERIAPVSEEKTFAVPSTLESLEFNGMPPAKCQDWLQASSDGLQIQSKVP